MDLVLEKFGFRLEVSAEQGGCVRSFRIGDEDILRAAPDGDGPLDPLQSACFPLFPFSGRIKDGRFSWAGQSIAVEPNFPPEPHAIHGQSWRSAWVIDRQGDGEGAISYTHAADSWPWAYRAVQTFRLLPDGLSVGLDLTNLSAKPMPAGVGWHPYFPRGGARLSANVSRVWTASKGTVPDTLSPLSAANDLRNVHAVDSLDLDHAFEARPASACITWPSRNLRVEIESSDTLSHLIVYVPKGQDFFCVEPVSHAPDAVNLKQDAAITGLRTLAPGENFSGRITLSVSETDGI